MPICPIAAKYDATVHIAMARALPTPVDFRFRCVATRLLTDEEGRITSVEYDEWSANGERREGRSITADRVVVAAHAIETPLLLLVSGLAPQGPVGLHLMDHPQGYGGAILPAPVYGFRGPPVVSGVDEFRDGDFRAHRAAFRISLGNDGWGRLQPLEQVVDDRIFGDRLLGQELRDAINARGIRMFRMSFSTEMLPDPHNRVEVGELDAKGNPRPKLHFTFPEYNRSTFEVATALFGEMFRRLGATETRFSFPDTDFSGAGHIVGTCRMGATATDSVVDQFGRAHEHPNLYLVGAATFPRSGRRSRR